MLISLHKFGASVITVCAVLFLLTLAGTVSAQEEGEVITASTSEESSSEVQKTSPYKTENLLDDKVFGDFVLGPGKVELSINPGESRTVELNVTNRMDKEKKFSIEIEDMGGSNNPNNPVVLLGDNTGPYTLKDYISIPHMSFDLAQNKRALVPVTITVPPDAEPGGMYGSVLVKTVTVEAGKGDEQQTTPRSAIESRIGTLFFITVPGDVEAEGELKDFSVLNNKSWFEKGPIGMSILYENTGSIHLNPYGEIRINNMFGEEVGYQELQPWFVLPQAVRSRDISWNRDFLYGRYTATLALNRGYDDIIDEKEIVFLVIPWKIGLVAFAVLFVFFWIVRNFFKSFEFKRKVN